MKTIQSLPRCLNAAVFSATSLAAMLASEPAQADDHLVEIQWRADGGFEYSGTIQPGKFVEVCGKLSKGTAVKWQFETSAATDFNLHYHQGKEVIFPAKVNGAEQGVATLEVMLDQDYCWMWKNKTSQPVTLKLSLKR